MAGNLNFENRSRIAHFMKEKGTKWAHFLLQILHSLKKRGNVPFLKRLWSKNNFYYIKKRGKFKFRVQNPFRVRLELERVQNARLELEPNPKIRTRSSPRKKASQLCKRARRRRRLLETHIASHAHTARRPAVTWRRLRGRSRGRLPAQ